MSSDPHSRARTPPKDSTPLADKSSEEPRALRGPALEAAVALVTWDESYSVKVQKCDEDHKKLFSMLNSLHDAMKAGRGKDVVQQTVKDLADYTKFHFAREEEMLKKADFPGLEPHREQHAEFVKKVEQFSRDLKEGKAGESVAVAQFIQTWLVNHIQKIDRQYSAHLNAHGIS
jgi:hemerythrin